LGERLPRTFYAQDTLSVARHMLGQHLVRNYAGERLVGRIVEVEAYQGESDTACHAAAGRTARNATMYGPPGHAYVYFVYGLHHCLNTVTESAGYPAAVLIRALEPQGGLGIMHRLRPGAKGRDEALTDGPAKLCQALAIDRTLDGADLVEGPHLWLEAAAAPNPSQIQTSPRIGIRGDGKALAVPWRFYLADNPWVSR
jgi:DNA-3-methyladenine glycosylase